MIFVTARGGEWHDHVVTVATVGNRDGLLKCAQRRSLGIFVNHRNRPRSASKFLAIVHSGADPFNEPVTYWKPSVAPMRGPIPELSDASSHSDS